MRKQRLLLRPYPTDKSPCYEDDRERSDSSANMRKPHWRTLLGQHVRSPSQSRQPRQVYKEQLQLFVTTGANWDHWLGLDGAMTK